MCERQVSNIFMQWMKIEHVIYFHPIRSKEPPVFHFLTLDSIKYFYKMAATAGRTCGEMGINSQNKNCRVHREIIGWENLIV